MPVFPSGRNATGRVRTRFSTKFMEDFFADWQEHGMTALKVVRQRDPATYLRAAVAVLPKELAVETFTSGLNPEERSEMITALKKLLTERQQERLLSEPKESPLLIEVKANEPAND